MRIFNICENHGIIPPKFSNLKDGFEVVLYKEKKNSKGKNKNGELNGELNEKQKLIYNKIKNKPGIKANQLSEILNIPFSTMDKNIRILLKNKLIERKGSKKTGGYYVIVY